VIARVGVAIIGTLSLVLVVANVVLIALPRAVPIPDSYGAPEAGLAIGGVATVVGAAIALKYPANGVGWILLVSGFFGGVLGAAGLYAPYAIVERGGALPGADWALWLPQFAGPWSVGLISTVLLLVFPNGHLPSPRWRPVAWYTGFVLVAWPLIGGLFAGSVGQATPAPNPIALPIAFRLDQAEVRPIGLALSIPATIMCGAAFISRFRSARGGERQQLKWVAYAVAILVVGVAVLLPVSFGRKPLEILQQLIVLALPLAVGIAILRYRLYDIDLLINRTIVYGATSAAIAVTFYLGLVSLQTVLRPLTAGSELAVAVSTLVSFALFQPVRRRVQDAVDRRFDRSRYDAARTLELFADRLRDEVDLDKVRADLIDAVARSVHPGHASMWLRR
jgi:hypothetical protein